ncbi:hypothetical protein DFH06DRAFT_750211 [Mycena polygramma]|nr:hypothetical protein DFH06DRAFT_750211 [Mycena polygramma]
MNKPCSFRPQEAETDPRPTRAAGPPKKTERTREENHPPLSTSTGHEAVRSVATITSGNEVNADRRLLPRPSITVYEALYNNGFIMGISCPTVVPMKSRAQPPSVPEQLQPTITQLLTIHPL